MAHKYQLCHSCFSHLEAIEVWVEDVSILYVGLEAHGEFFVALMSDVHNVLYFNRHTVHTWYEKNRQCQN